MNRHTLELVRWVDSVQPVPEWRFLSDLPELSVVHCTSVGWVVAEDGDTVMLAQSYGLLGSEDQAGGIFRVPKASIMRRDRLTVWPRDEA